MEVLLGGTALVIILGLMIAASTFLYFVPMGLWISAVTAGVPLRVSELIGMRLNKVDPHPIVILLIAAQKAGVEVSARQLEAHQRAGGHVQEVVNTLIRARMANVELAFAEVAALDLADDDGETLATLLETIETQRT